MNFLKAMDETLKKGVKYTPSPHIMRFPLAWFPLTQIWPMCVQVGEFCVH